MRSVQYRMLRLIEIQLGVPVSEIEPEHCFMKDLGGDSLDLVELVMFMEDEFEIEIDDRALEKVPTIGDAISLVTKILVQKSVDANVGGRISRYYDNGYAIA